jgi:hypothetical protein
VAQGNRGPFTSFLGGCVSPLMFDV